jgi:hypothetical protein
MGGRNTGTQAALWIRWPAVLRARRAPDRKGWSDMSLMGEADNERARADRLPEGDVIAVLLAQHAEIRDLFGAVLAAPRNERRQPYDKLRALLAVHEAGEEMVLRPISRKSAGAHVVDARNQEENDAAYVLAELDDMDPSGEQFAAKIEELAKAVADHAELEETEEFPTVVTAQTVLERRALGEKLLKAEHEARSEYKD